MFYVFHNGMLKRILRFGFSASTGAGGGADCARTDSMDGGVGLLCRKNRCTLLVVALTPRSLSQSAIEGDIYLRANRTSIKLPSKRPRQMVAALIEARKSAMFDSATLLLLPTSPPPA